MQASFGLNSRTCSAIALLMLFAVAFAQLSASIMHHDECIAELVECEKDIDSEKETEEVDDTTPHFLSYYADLELQHELIPKCCAGDVQELAHANEVLTPPPEC
ncbi:MAG: hypothetical protein MK081_08145 [Flavobacteriales bacterium]|nr:hypothetical protein [Flavobacteriales bacterium]